METPVILKRHRAHNKFKAALSIVLSRLKQSNYRRTNEVFTLKSSNYLSMAGVRFR